ncbi:MAG: hypothetical protein QM783_12030 [Phycisphaerales bacterium]
MAVGFSVCLAGLTLWTARLLVKPAVSILSRTVKARGRLSVGGWTVLAAATAALLLSVHTAAVRLMLLHAESLDDAVRVSAADAFAHKVPPDQLQAAQKALNAYSAAMAVTSGGIGLLDTPAAQLRMAWLAVVCGDLRRAEKLMTAVIEREGPTDGALLQRARITLAAGDRTRAVNDLTAAVKAKPALLQAASGACSMLLEERRVTEATDLLTRCRDARPWDPQAHASLAELQLAVGDTAAALDDYRKAAVLAHVTPEIQARYLVLELLAGDRVRVESTLNQWSRADRDATRSVAGRAADQLRQFGRDDAADRLLAITPR